MTTPREILLRRHQAVSAKLDAIRGQVVAGLMGAGSGKGRSWCELARPLRWHVLGWGAAWVTVLLLNIDPAGHKAEPNQGHRMPSAQQISASMRERRQLLMEAGEAPVVEPTPAPGRRSEIDREGVEV